MIKLQDQFGIQLPNPNYFTCELPAEWITILNQKKEVEYNRFERQMTSQTLKRVSTAHTKLQKSKFEGSSLQQKILYSQINLKKEIQLYEIDEKEHKTKKSRQFQQYDL